MKRLPVLLFTASLLVTLLAAGAIRASINPWGIVDRAEIPRFLTASALFIVGVFASSISGGMLAFRFGRRLRVKHLREKGLTT